MEELRRLAAQYYQHTVGKRFFGKKGWCFIIVSMPFFLISIHFAKQDNTLMMLFEFISVIFWFMAKKEYDRNLIRHLSYYSMIDSNIVSDHKSVYLSVITNHISSSLFESTRYFKEIIETNNKYRGFVLDNIAYRFSRFLYDHEAKNRILSLIIYLISLVALLTVAKSDPQYAYEFISQISLKSTLYFFATGAFFIISGYFLLVIPIMFVKTFVVNPLLLHFSIADITVRFFISELNRYSFIEKRILMMNH